MNTSSPQVVVLRFQDGDAQELYDFFGRHADGHGLPPDCVRLERGRPPGSFGSVDASSVVVAIAGSATAVTIARGLVAVLRDFLQQRHELKKIAMTRSRIKIEVGGRGIEVDVGTSTKEWRRIKDILTHVGDSDAMSTDRDKD